MQITQLMTSQCISKIFPKSSVICNNVDIFPTKVQNTKLLTVAYTYSFNCKFVIVTCYKISNLNYTYYDSDVISCVRPYKTNFFILITA